MYNEEIKKRYIVEKENSTSIPEGFLYKQFSKTESFENFYGKDLCNFTKHEILNMYKTFNTSSLDFLTVINSHFSLYTQWCLCQNLVEDFQNHFSVIDRESLLTCVNTIAIKKSIITRETLYDWIRQLPNPSDGFVMLALFEGIKGKEFCEIINLKMSDFEENTVTLCTGRKFKVSDKLVELAKESNETLDYYSITGKGKKQVQLMAEDLVVKNYPNCDDNVDTFTLGRRIYRKVIRSFDFLGVSEWMKPNSLVESGKIDYINNRSKELDMTYEEYLNSPYVKEIKQKYEFDMSRLKFGFLSKYKEFLS